MANTSTIDGTLASLASGLLSGQIHVVDCSAPLGPSTPLEAMGPAPADQQPAVEIHKISEYDEDGPFFAWNWLKVSEHAGTHFDAPSAAGGQLSDHGSTDTLNPQTLAAPVCVIDVKSQCTEDPGYLLTPADVQAWEQTHGDIPPGSWVVMHSGWAGRADHPAHFLNAGVHPGPDADCMRYMISKGIVGFGSECVATDAGQAATMDPPYPARQLLHEANLFGLASLINLDRLPPKGAVLIAAPLKFVNGTGSPTRAMALVPA